MKQSIVVVLIAIVCAGLSAFRLFEDSAVGVLKQLGIPEDVAQESIWSSLRGGYFSNPGGTELKKTAPESRAAIVQQIGDFARTYTNTVEFKKRYAQYREDQKPSPPDSPKYSKELKEEQRATLKQSIAETEESMKSVPSDQQELFKTVVGTLKDQLKSLDDPNNQIFNPRMDEIIKQSYEQEEQRYRQNLVEWEQKYSTSPTPMIKQWLENFLDATKDVDFSAKLVDDGSGRKRFVKPEYENKSSEWKLCYRAGKETVEAGRKYAKEWLATLH